MTENPEEIMHMDTTRARYNPASVFERPLDIVQSVGLTRGQKIATLERWQQEIIEQLAATNEGMPNNGHATRSASILDEIKIAIGQLRTANATDDAPEKSPV